MKKYLRSGPEDLRGALWVESICPSGSTTRSEFTVLPLPAVQQSQLQSPGLSPHQADIYNGPGESTCIQPDKLHGHK